VNFILPFTVVFERCKRTIWHIYIQKEGAPVALNSLQIHSFDPTFISTGKTRQEIFRKGKRYGMWSRLSLSALPNRRCFCSRMKAGRYRKANINPARPTAKYRKFPPTSPPPMPMLESRISIMHDCCIFKVSSKR